MALVARLSFYDSGDIEPEDIFASSLGVIFPDDVTNQHGDATQSLLYTSPKLPKPLHITLADPTKDEERRLFSHFLWNSSLLVAEMIETGTLETGDGGDDDVEERGRESDEKVGLSFMKFDVTGLRTVELGAGTGLPSMMASLLGAGRVVVTDYPAADVLETLRENMKRNVTPEHVPHPLPKAQLRQPSGKAAVLPAPIEVYPHKWGTFNDMPPDLHHAFDRVIASDCLWMPWEHANLHRSIEWYLADAPEARAWVVAGFHTGRKIIGSFFDNEALREAGLEIERLWERDCDGISRPWADEREDEDPTNRKRWYVIGVLRKIRS